MGDIEVISALCCFIVLPFVLQAVGVFSPYWVSDSTCDSHGLMYSCCTGSSNDSCSNTDGGDELDVRVLGLETTAFAMMFLAVFGMCCETCCGEDGGETGWCGILGGCCLVMFPVAGFFSFIGCMIIATDYSTSQLGWSFYLCLTSSCFVLLVTIIMCCCIRKLMKDDNDDDVPSQPRQSNAVISQGGGGIAPYGGDHIVAAQVEQRAVYHDAESGSIFFMMRKINIAHMVHTFRHDDN